MSRCSSTCGDRQRRQDSPPRGDSSLDADQGRTEIDDFDRELDAVADGPGHPTFRATVVGDRLTLNDWWPFLLTGGPARAHFRARRDDGVAIADLRRWRTDDGSGELSVEFLSGGGRARAERLIERWARLAGYSRLWFPERMIELDAEGTPSIPAVEAVCPTCGAAWDDDVPEFWQSVRESGCFPRTCPLCGGELPQWSPAEANHPGSAKVGRTFHQERSRDPAR